MHYDITPNGVTLLCPYNNIFHSCLSPHTSKVLLHYQAIPGTVLGSGMGGDLSGDRPEYIWTDQDLRRVSHQYTLQDPTYISNDTNDDLLLYRTLGRGVLPSASISVRLMRVGKLGKVRVARLGGVDNMRLTGPSVYKDAGYVIISAAKYWPRSTRHYPFILWLDERKPGNIAYSRMKEFISSWSRRLLQHF